MERTDLISYQRKIADIEEAENRELKIKYPSVREMPPDYLSNDKLNRFHEVETYLLDSVTEVMDELLVHEYKLEKDFYDKNRDSSKYVDFSLSFNFNGIQFRATFGYSPRGIFSKEYIGCSPCITVPEDKTTSYFWKPMKPSEALDFIADPESKSIARVNSVGIYGSDIDKDSVRQLVQVVLLCAEQVKN